MIGVGRETDRRVTMKKKTKRFTAVSIGIMLMVTACAGQQPPVTLGPAKGEVVLAMKASDFKFEPNNIKAFKGDVIVFRVENTSGTNHNFTVKDAQGRLLQSTALPSKETVEIRVALAETGIYEFYCDKPFHSGFGMKGRIEVSEGP